MMAGRAKRNQSSAGGKSLSPSIDVNRWWHGLYVASAHANVVRAKQNMKQWLLVLQYSSKFEKDTLEMFETMYGSRDSIGTHNFLALNGWVQGSVPDSGFSGDLTQGGK